MLTVLKEKLKLSLEALFKKKEETLIRKDIGIGYPVIFIIGPPRTGSTLLYQLITRCFKVCYFSNFMMRFPFSPCYIAKFIAPFNACDPPNYFDSSYGEIDGWKAPSQGYKAWNRWFPDDQSYVGSGAISKEKLRELRNTIALLQIFFKAPFVNKWQGHSVRILPLVEAFPEVLFIRIKKEPELSAQSILHGRRLFLGDEKKWMSTRPREYNEIIHKEPIQQVCEQVFYIEKNIDLDIKHIGESKCMTVDYEELCASPPKVMDQINSFIINQGINRPLEQRHNIPSSFPCDHKISVSDSEYRKIENYLAKLRKQNQF